MVKFKSPIVLLIMLFIFNLGFEGHTHAVEDERRLNSNNPSIALHTEKSIEKVNLHIYKIGGKFFNIKEPIDHDLSKLTDEDIKAILGPAAKGLAGIKFTYWKINREQYEELKKEKADTVDKVKEIIGEENNGKEIGPTNEEGLVTESIPIDESGDLSYYYFVESGGLGEVIDSMAVPFAITLPMQKPNSTEYLEDIYIYPKNIIDKTKPNPEKKLITQRQ